MLTSIKQRIYVHLSFPVHPSVEKSKEEWLKKMYKLVAKNLARKNIQMFQQDKFQKTASGSSTLNIEIFTYINEISQNNEDHWIELKAQYNSRFSVENKIWFMDKKMCCKGEKNTIPALESWINEVSVTFAIDKQYLQE